MNFKELVEKLEYLYIANTVDMTPEEVGECIRNYIRKSGWDCMDETWNEEEEAENWFAENHPNLLNELGEIDASSVANIDFLCESDGYITGHDVDWHTFQISFWGVWGKIGIFSVSF